MTDDRAVLKSDLDKIETKIETLIKDEAKKTRQDFRDLTVKIDNEAIINAGQAVEIQNNTEAIKALSNRLWVVCAAFIGGAITMFFSIFKTGGAGA